MALEVLKDVVEIGGFKVGHDDTVTNDTFIAIDHSWNSIGFCIQKGPIREVGVNGAQIQTMIEAAALILEKLNEKFPDENNVKTIEHLHAAIDFQKQRTAEREKRGVEGTSQV